MVLGQRKLARRHRNGLLVLGLSLSTLGCDREPPPWAAPPGSPPPTALPSEPWIAPSGSASRSRWLDAEWAQPSAQAEIPDEPTLDLRPPRPGGLWASCADGFRPGHHGSPPSVDVVRLGALCGPPTGMRPGGPVHAGQVDNERPARHEYDVRAGHCYRAFAVAPGVERLSLVARIDDDEVARAEGAHWLRLEPSRPFCFVERGGHLTLELRADGAGPYALQLWKAAPADR